MRKCIIRVLMFCLVFSLIKNIQTILLVLFEYREIVLLIFTCLLSTIIIILNCLSKRQDKTKQINHKRNNI